MPPHHTYIETHLGGGNVLERKKPAARNIGIDVDRSLIARWRERRRRLPFELELAAADAADFLKAFPFKGGELVYSDPPYLHSTRRTLDLYSYEYTDEQHIELLDVLTKIPCFVIVSGYPSPIYKSLLEEGHGWRCVEFPSATRRGRVIECAWFNFEPPIVLHDCRFAGADYRERERIKRKRNRWRKKFEGMDADERQVIYEALTDVARAESGDVVRLGGFDGGILPSETASQDLASHLTMAPAIVNDK